MSTTKDISKLHIITDDLSVIEQACTAGANWIQLRIKDKLVEEIETTALSAWKICNSYDTTFILNDHVELAKRVKAHGVHLGKKDMLPSKAREILGPDFIIGGTANTLDDMLWCTSEGCDYIGLGPYRFTETKKELAPVLGDCHMIDLIEAYSLKTQNPLPVIAIGGIRQEDIKTIIDMGYQGVAVSSAIAQADNIEQATIEFNKQLNYGTVSYC